jgi:hypothetical protein
VLNSNRVSGMTNKALYSPSLEERFFATVTAGRIDLGRRWPIACDGAANAFLVLIGPSPGSPTPGEAVQLGGADRPLHRSMELGANVIAFDWGGQRVKRWERMCAAILGGDKYWPALTALLNLDWQHSGDEKRIQQASLAYGLNNYVWPLLSDLRPRIVCALTNSVWDVLRPAAEENLIAFPPCPVALSRQPLVFRIPTSDFNTVLIKPHNHPSRHFLTEAHIASMGAACRWFLAEDTGD